LKDTLIEISGYVSGKIVDGKHLMMAVVGYIGGRDTKISKISTQRDVNTGIHQYDISFDKSPNS